MAEPFKHIYKVDLNQPLKRFDVGDILATGDEKANSFEVTVCRDGVNVDLSGCAVYGYFIRPNEETMKVNGTANGNKARVDLSKNCYVYDGDFSFAIKVKGNGIEQTVAVFDGGIVKTTTETIVDGDRVIYTLEDLVAQIAATEAAADRANSAAERAEQLKIDASGLAGDSNKLGGRPPEAYAAVNLLDNSDFTNPVNQRGTTSPVSTAGTYLYDRWKVNAGTWDFNEEGIMLTTDTGNIQQRLEYKNYMNEKPYTLGIYYTDGTIETKKYNTLPVGSNNAYFYLNITPTKNKRVKSFALYEGSYTAETLPPFVPPDPTLELAKCQECYVWLGSDAGIYGYTGSAGTIYAFIPLPQSMRLKNVSLGANSKILIATNGVLTEISEFSSQTMRGNQLELAAKANSNLPALTTFSGWVSMMGISADL